MSFILSTIILVVTDYLYISSVSSYYSTMIKNIQGSPIKIKLIGVILCYILLSYGLNYFIIKNKKPIKDAFILGFIIYGIFELTNYSIIDKWTTLSVISDTLWVGILFSLTTYITYKITNQEFLI